MAAEVTGVLVKAAQLDRASHTVTIRLQNTTARPVSALRFALVATLGNGSTTTGYNEADNILGPDKELIRPSADFEKPVGVPTDAVGIAVQLIAVVFTDDTAEGDPSAIQSIFARRQNWSDGFRQGADALAEAAAGPGNHTGETLARAVRTRRSEALRQGRTRTVAELDRDVMVDDVAQRIEQATATEDIQDAARAVAAATRATADMLSTHSKRRGQQ